MKKTTLDDMWKVLTPRQCALAAADIAELVLHVYEKKYPGDGRPREAIKAARGNDKNKAQVAANAAAHAAHAAYFAKKSNKRTKKEMELEQMHIAIDYLIGDRGE